MTSTSWEWQVLDARNPPCPRSSHQLSSLGSRIFLFGGENGPTKSHFGYGLPVASTAVHWLDLDSPDAWTEVFITAGSPPTARLGHAQAIVEGLEGAHLYVFGGRQPQEEDNLEIIRSLNDLHRLDLTSGVWEEICGTGDVPSVRSYHQMVVVGQTLYVFAGMVNSDRYCDLYAFNTEQQHWTRLAPAPMEGRGGPGLCVTREGQEAALVVIAGFCGRPMADVWQYHIASGTWLPLADWTLPMARSIFAFGTLMSDSLSKTAAICIFGGELENFDAALIAQGQDPTLKASLYSNETLLLLSNPGLFSVQVVKSSKSLPVARGWTAGCSASVEGKRCFVAFGGVREGQDGEPSGVRLGDLLILKCT